MGPRFKNSFTVLLIGAQLLLLTTIYEMNSLSSLAHTVEISGEVGGTLHVEPNDSPQAGKPNLIWFALTRRGGQPISLSECNCMLAVYQEPRQQNDVPVQQPTLNATSAEGKQGIPSATVTFPHVGSYELVLQGTPTTDGTFAPFELKFSVTVVQGG